jgi:hypothetical protein
MSTFNRQFDVDGAEKAVHLPENTWFRDLLKYWRPAGEAAGDHREPQNEPQPEAVHLRLAIRDGYLNFYRAGQSVAEVRFSNGKLEGRVHNKYVYGEKGSGQKYVKITDGGFTGCDGSLVRYTDDLVRNWSLAACDYAGGEKLFVDELVAHNANVIDLEAGLPADPELWDEKSAPRMDLVALEPCGNHWKLVFWEAKLVTNPEARCEGESPKVIGQLDKYERWLKKNRNTVRESYRRSCEDLVKLHAIAKSLCPDKADLGAGIVMVDGQDPSELCLDRQPRLIIDDTHKNASFTAHGHLKKLRNLGVHVHMVQSAADMVLGG